MSELIVNSIYIFSLSLLFEVFGINVREDNNLMPIDDLCQSVFKAKIEFAYPKIQSPNALPSFASAKYAVKKPLFSVHK